MERDKCPHQNSSLWIREKNFMFPISRQEIQYYYDYFPSTTKLQFLSVANDVTHSPCQKKLGNCKHTDEIWHDAGQYNSWIHWQIAIIGLMQSLAESMEKPPETVKLIRNFWDWKLCKHCLARGKKIWTWKEDNEAEDKIFFSKEIQVAASAAPEILNDFHREWTN